MNSCAVRKPSVLLCGPLWGKSADLQVMVLKAGNIGPSLNSQTGSAAELGVAAERCLHRYFLECEEMNSSLSAAVAAPDVTPSSIWHIWCVAFVKVVSGAYRYTPRADRPANQAWCAFVREFKLFEQQYRHAMKHNTAQHNAMQKSAMSYHAVQYITF